MNSSCWRLLQRSDALIPNSMTLPITSSWLSSFNSLRLPPWVDDESLEAYSNCIVKMRRIENIEPSFISNQFFVSVYMDNKHENTLPLGVSQSDLYKEINLIKIETSDKFKDTLSGLTDEWHVDGQDQPSMRPLIQHYYVLKTVWNHANGDGDFTVEFLKEIHLHLMSGAYEKDFKDKCTPFPAGEIRTVPVSAGCCVFMDPKDIALNLSDLIDKINNISVIDQIMIIFRDFLLIHPFVNGNGRTARLLLNWMICRHKVSKFPIVLTSGKKQSRQHYIQSLNKYDQGIMHHLQFLFLASMGEVSGNYLALYSK